MPPITQDTFTSPIRNPEFNPDTMLEDDDDILVIGIDFGTTFSGVSWATKADYKSKKIHQVLSWPGSGREEGKAPTELYYEDEKIMWGYNVDSDVDPVRWFKLLLVKKEDLSPELQASDFLILARQSLESLGKTATDVISDYLRMLWMHTLKTITRARGENVLDALQFHVVITVPAIWKEYAREAMREAVKKAGILESRKLAGPTILTFAPEPEVAALATLCDAKIKENEVYIVCDAGGGTVDLISYKVESANPIRMHEAVEGIGGLCGGIFIDQAFKKMVRARLGRMWDHLSNIGIKAIMSEEWEHSIKPQFDCTPNKKHIVSIPAEAFRAQQSLTSKDKKPHIISGRIHFESQHLKECFTKSFADIDKLVDSQILEAKNKGLAVTAIILVGGLGGSPHLYQHLVTRPETSKITILRPPGLEPRTAISRGAVIKGFLELASTLPGRSTALSKWTAPIQVTSTVSRASYGVTCWKDFDENTDNEEDRYWDEVEQKYKCTTMEWFLKKGENVSEKDPVTKSFYQLYKKDFGGSWAERIYVCEDAIPPTREIPSVKLICQVKWFLDIPFSHLPEYQNSKGEMMKKLRYSIKMIPSGASMNFAVFVGERELGKENVDIKFV